ncbi:MAG: hypothetical protein MZV64_00100 [Ignavibacteriales bacterium]|nr:hypothetical protein [Ignavibacteriales bacterium]
MSADDWRAAVECLAREREDPHLHRGGHREVQGSLVTARGDDFHAQLVPRGHPSHAGTAEGAARQSADLDDVGHEGFRAQPPHGASQHGLRGRGQPDLLPRSDPLGTARRGEGCVVNHYLVDFIFDKA